MTVLILVTLFFGYIHEDGDSLIVDNDTLTICGLHQYLYKVHLKNQGILLVRAATGAPDTTGWLVLDAPLIIAANQSSINGSERGHKGAYMNNHPWGYGPGGGGAAGVSGGAGGGGAYGGNGGAGGDNYGGAGGVAYGDSADTLIDMGSGGGAGRLSVVDGPGGSGGASVALRASMIEMDSSNVLVSGQRGFNGSVEAGGGGAGGGVMILSDTVNLHHVSFNANGGAGGDAPFGGGGGAGGGRIKILYSTSLDTSALTTYVQAGNAGIGAYGNPQPGMSGTVYIGIQTGILEIVTGPHHTFAIQPNPSQGIIYVCASRAQIDIGIYDCTGRRVRSIYLATDNRTVDLRDLKPGVYFLKAQGCGSSTKKLIIAP